MMVRRTLAVLVLLVPGVVGYWALETTLTAEAMATVQAPRYPQVTSEQFVASDVTREQLANAAASSMQKHGEMERVWLGALQTSHRAVAALIIVSAVLALALCFMLWRRPIGAVR
jgi:hypothetical protein